MSDKAASKTKAKMFFIPKAQNTTQETDGKQDTRARTTANKKQTQLALDKFHSYETKTQQFVCVQPMDL